MRRSEADGKRRRGDGGTRREAGVRKLIARLICFFRGHDFGNVVYVSPAVLTYCHRGCGKELQDRTFDDLQPMTDEDYEALEDLEGMI